MKKLNIIFFSILFFIFYCNSQELLEYVPGKATIRLTQSACSGLNITSPKHPHIITNKSELNFLFRLLNIYQMESLTFPGDTSIMSR